MTPDQASVALRKGQVLDVDLDTAEAAVALTVPYVFRLIDPTQTDGTSGHSKFRRLCDNAGLPGNHPALASWLAIRSLRPQPGDALIVAYDCPITVALASALGTVSTAANAHILRDDRTVPDALSITAAPFVAGETGVVVTPSGVIRIPGTPVACPVGTWATALAAIDRIPATLARKAYDSDPDATVELDYMRPEKGGSVDADSIHEDWTPEIAVHADLKEHPARLIQSATLATVTPPVAFYKPRLPRRVINSGFISNAQFEFIVAAGEAHNRHLPMDQETGVAARTGIFLADGTGAGKTNEILGVILDNALRGRKKAVLVLSKRRHRHGFLKAWAMMGRDRRDFIFQWDHKASAKIPSRSGILVTTYSTLRDYEKSDSTFPRNDQIIAWAGDSFDGVMAFDESQDMRNAAGSEDQSGKSITSIQGVAGLDIQDRLPEARIIYASATGATDVHNLAYATRLGLWGEGTCFPDRCNFIKTFEEGGIADLEQVTLSLKAAGVYMARSLSFEGVETTHLAVTLTPQERTVYNQAAEAWGRLWDTFQFAAKICNVPLGDKDKMSDLRKTGLAGSVPYSNLNGIFEANRKSSMATLIAAFKARAVIADAKKQIDEGRSVVIQMQNTYEAQLDRALARADNLEDIRLEPAELVSFAESIPIVEYEIINDTNAAGDDIKRYVMKVDSDGEPVINQGAKNLRDQLVLEMKQIKLPLPPLDQIMLAFGPARLAEVTGRTKRLVPNRPNGDRDGATGVILEDRTETQRMQDIDDFHNGKKLALVFSTGAGGASLSYHAQRGSKNERRRVHYVIQLGYRADEVTQGFGRTHRADQVEPPILSIVSCDLPADRLYASRIVSSLFKLGALTQGHRHAASNGMFDERDCLDGPYAVGAWDDLQHDIAEGLVPDYTWEQFMRDLGLSSKGEEEHEVWGKVKLRGVLTDINRMINRVAALTDRRQDLIFQQLRERIDTRIEKAIADGTFNAGPETLKATSLQIISERIIKHDPVHGAATRLLRIRKKSEMAKNTFADAYRLYMRGRSGVSGQATFCKHRTTGQVALIAIGKPAIDLMGRKMGTRDIVTPTSTTNRFARIVDREPWIPMSDFDMLESLWNATVESAPDETTSYVTIAADALLPVWTALRTASGYRNAVYRLQTDDGQQIVGRPLSADALDHFFSMIEVSPTPTSTEIDEIVNHLKQGSRVALASKHKAPHFLSGTFTGGKLTGVDLELGATASSALSIQIDSFPGAPITRGPGTTVAIAQRASAIAPALATILASAPALYVDETGRTAQAAPTIAAPAAAPAMASQAMQQAA